MVLSTAPLRDMYRSLPIARKLTTVYPGKRDATLARRKEAKDRTLPTRRHYNRAII